MKRKSQRQLRALMIAVVAAQAACVSQVARAQVTFQQVTNGLVDYYPLNVVVTNGSTYTTPDYIGGRDLILNNMTGANLVPAGHPTLNPASTNLCMNLTQSGGATVMYYNSKGQHPLDGSGDFLPFCNQVNATMNFWIKCSATTGYNDTRFFGEADTTGGQSAPLWLFGTSSSGGLGTDTHAHFLFREDPTGSTTSPQTLVDGSLQWPYPGYFWTQGNDYTASNPLDASWHMMTVEIESNRVMDIFIDGVRDPGPGTFTDQNGNSNYGPDMPLTNNYYTTNIYASATVSNPPPNGFVRWMWNATFKTGSTTFGGFKRGSISAGLPCQYGEIGFWNRQLGTNEIQFVYTNGLPGIQPARLLLVNGFSADMPEVGTGDGVTLRWNVVGALTNAGGIVISGVGDVTKLGLIGSTNVTLSQSQTYTFTLTAHNGVNPDQTSSVTVGTFPGVSSAWHLIERFDGQFGADTTQGIATNQWVSVKSSYAANFDRWNVVTITNGTALNRVMTPRTGYNADINSPNGYDSEGAMAYANLSGLAMTPGQSNTLFFRFSLQEAPVPTGASTLYSDLDFGVGLTDYTPINPSAGLTGSATVAYYGGTGGGFGPYFSIARNSAGTFAGGPFDLSAPDTADAADGNTAGSFSYLAAVDPNGLQTNVNYLVWMDIVDRQTAANTNASTTTNQALYSVWIQKQGDPARTNLFHGFHGNRDYINYNPVNDLPTPRLDRILFNIGSETLTSAAGGSYFGTNMIAVDDIYLSKSGLSSTVPRLFDVRSVVKGTSSVTVTWDSLGSLYGTNTYSIQRSPSLVNPTWTTLAQIPSGGSSTTYTDNSLGTNNSVFYRISWP